MRSMCALLAEDDKVDQYMYNVTTSAIQFHGEEQLGQIQQVVVKMVERMSSSSIRLLQMLILATTLLANGDKLNFPMMIIFGDSTVDVGTNNYLDTLVKCDFRPYGRDLGPSQVGTGRFSNGYLVPDFIVQELGLQAPLPYLDPEAKGEKLLSGINFASSGSGWLESTAEIFLVRSFKQQLQDFRNYTSNLIELVGPNRAAELLSSALYVISTGSNDFVNNYFLVERDSYTVPQWQEQIRSNAAEYIQEIYNAGARKVLVASLPAIGCIPAAISLYGEGKDQCVSYVNDAAVGTNSLIQNTLWNLQSNLPGVKFLFIDTYTDLFHAFQNPSLYGFVETRNACCGTGKIEVAILCNSDSPGTCSDASKYLFFDSFHPSQVFYKLISQKSLSALLSNF